MSDSLEILKKLEEFSLTDVQKINLSCGIQLLEGISTRKIKENLHQMSNLTKEERERINKLEQKNYLSRLRTRLRKNPTCIFKKEDFLDLFLKKYPSPQFANLPFINWDAEILKHFLEIAYKYETSDRRLKDALSRHPVMQTLPFLTISENKLNSDDTKTYLLILRFIKKENSKKFTHFVPINFNCQDLDVKIYKEHKCNFQSNNHKYNRIDIYNIAENYLSKSLNPKNAIFFVLSFTTEKTEKIFRESLLARSKLPKSTFIFITYSELKQLSLANATTYMYDFFEWLDPWYKEIKKIPNNRNAQFFIDEFNDLEKKYIK